MAVPFLRGGWLSAYQVSFNYFRKWIYAWNGALSPSPPYQKWLFPLSLIVHRHPPHFPFAPFFFLFSFFFFFTSHGNISWKSGNNLLSLPPVIYRPPLFRNVPDRISPFNLPAFIPRYRARVRTRISFPPLRNFHDYSKVTRVYVEKKEKEKRKGSRRMDRLRSLRKRGAKGGKFSKNEKAGNEREREKQRIEKQR